MLQGVLALLQAAPGYEDIRHALAHGTAPLVLGPGGTAAACLIAAAATDPGAGVRPVLVITPSADAAERLADDLRTLLTGTGLQVARYPDASAPSLADGTGAPDSVPETAAAAERAAARLEILNALSSGAPVVVVASAASSVDPLPPPAALDAATRIIAMGQTLPRDRLVADLQTGGYERAALVANRGEFAVRGGVVDIFPVTATQPIRLELWGDEVDSIRALDALSQRSLEAVTSVTVAPVLLTPTDGAAAALPAFLPVGGLLVLVEPAEAEGLTRLIAERAERTGTVPPLDWAGVIDTGPDRRRMAIAAARAPQGRWHEVRLPSAGIDALGGQTHLLVEMLRGLAAQGTAVVIASAQATRLAGILTEAGLAVTLADRLDDPPAAGRIVAVPATLGRGCRFEVPPLAIVTDAEVVGWRRRRPRMRFLRDGERLATWADLGPGDLVVHVHHGIGRYRGLVRLPMDGSQREYLLLEYAGEDRLYVPIDQIGLVQRYIGTEGEAPRIHRLGGADWEREKRRVKEATREMAASLLALYAARATVPGHAFSPDTAWQRDMEAAFPYQETPHQLTAIEAVKRDMELPKPMDRLVAGDVGYGKTEVALRAAFKAVMDGKQVAVVAPTTILAQQHFSVFGERFARYPVTVELLSRFREPAEQKTVLAGLAAGSVDVVIGTHRLLAKDVRFRDLGLVIVDEEQRFGVAHKEHLKTLRRSVDVLTLTATPIPRTLHMSLAGLRDLTVMETPPEARVPIHTEIRPHDDALMREAILREHARGGQVYVVHNRVESIERAGRRIRRLIPEVRVGIAHGQMPEERLEQVMLDFLGGRFDVLVCTTIVEIGLDIPQVNTILIEDAHLMGLAQLYQLRGRVGRADRQAYCYLLYPRSTPLTAEAEQRLRAMAEFVELGSGLGLAMRDLEIRGAGNILGPEQHGHVAAVGFDLYCRLLDEAIREARGEVVGETPDPAMELGIDAYLPQAFLPDEHDRMAYYRRLAAARSIEEVDGLAAELGERGALPLPVQSLIEAVRVRAVARTAGVTSITREDGRFTVRLGAGGHLDDAAQRRLRSTLGSRAQVSAIGMTVPAVGKEFSEQARGLREVLTLLGHLAAHSVPG